MKSPLQASPPSRRPLRSPRSVKENVDPNPMTSSPAGRGSPAKNRAGLPPRPPRPPNPLKRKLILETPAENEPASSDSGVQVIVRMRPIDNNEEVRDRIVNKISSDSISVLDHAFTFDSVADTRSTQQDIFNLVGIPLVENCLAGFNSSIFAYGQTGSGKTYTMWGPQSALSEDALSGERGLTPRVFERLFLRVKEMSSAVSDKQLIYHCRCSFWEIYNEQIADLLNPEQRNLQIREGVKAGVYVEDLTEEPVDTPKDVTKLLLKGLANRKTSRTAVNAESSRSHCVFTCVVESRTKSFPDGLTSIRTSRINLVDLAGSERQKLSGAAGERLREAGNINRSLSQLGNLINILAEVSQSGKQRHIPYRDSKLTFLLQESLGGNAKLAMICAISPSQSCKNETLSTLRFAQRAKAIKNNAVINEIRQDDVNVLREQIRQLKDELVRMKSNGPTTENNGNYSTKWNARQSLKLLKMSLNCPATLSGIKDDSDEEMEIDENDVERPKVHACPQSSSHERSSADSSIKRSRDESFTNLNEKMLPKKDVSKISADMSNARNSLKVESQTGEGLQISSAMPASQNDKSFLNLSFAENSSGNHSETSLTRRRTNCSAPNDRLAASLHHGLQIIDNLQQNQALRMSAFRFSVRPTDIKSFMPIKKVDIGIQTSDLTSEEDVSKSLCRFCNNRLSDSQHNEVDGDKNLQLLTANETPVEVKEIPKAVEKVLAGAIRREMALQEHCTKQAAEIVQLNRLVQQYKHERGCNAIIVQTCEDKISRLENLMDGILPTEEFMDAEFTSLRNEHEILKARYENLPEVLRMDVELKRTVDKLDGYKNFFDLGERDILMEEIQDLRTNLQFYMNSSSAPSNLHKSIPANQHVSTSQEFPDEHNDKKVDQDVGSLTRQLRLELESSQHLVQKQKMELDTEKKCAEELKEALQIAMQGHARILEQYADLQEKNFDLLRRHQKISNGIEDVKREAEKAGIKGDKSRFINSLAAEISALRVDREQERRYWRDENRGLQTQLRDTTEAVQAAGELLVRLKEAQETLAVAQKRAIIAEQETEEAYQQIDRLKENYNKEILALNKLVEETRSQNNTSHTSAVCADIVYDHEGNDEFSKGTDPSTWYSGYDRCNL